MFRNALLLMVMSTSAAAVERVPIPFKMADRTVQLMQWHTQSVAELAAMEHSRSPAVRAFATFSRQQKNENFNTKIQRINNFVNQQVPYRTDEDTYGKRDYWATPYLVLNEGGDCEDLALLKGLALTAAGLGADSMRLILGTRDGIGHAVLAVQAPEEEFWLDNMERDPVLPHESKFIPLAGLNLDMNGSWIYGVKRSFVVQR